MARRRKYKPSQIPSFESFARTARERAEETLLDSVREFAEEELEAFKDAILGQNFPSFIEKPLTEKYQRRKERKGADPRVMIATQHYLDSMRIFERKEDEGRWLIYIGFDESDVAVNLDGEKTDFPLTALAEVHEFGAPVDAAEPNKRIPSRPHWSPHLRQMEKDAHGKRREIRRRIMDEIQKRAMSKL